METMESSGQFASQIAVITGAARGIGATTVHAFTREGANVVLLGIASAGERLARSPGELATFIRRDVGRAADVDAAFDDIATRFQEIDLLVNNDGIQHCGTVTPTWVAGISRGLT